MKNRKPLYENEMCKTVGLMASCNACDRIIFEDENWLKGYINSGGYCRECAEEIEREQSQETSKPPTMQQRATELRTRLKAMYSGNRMQLDFYCSQYIAGDHNKQLRREIIRQITGETLPLTKCGLHATADQLANSFEQYQLF